ncbi:VTT domain-containing protein [Streptomyces sp. GXMU-J15]|uniref:VTT domain-containing protein n=1 Tax=Streptomyces fuscus TaxID=3048495 RepID=A0ABT7J3H8_9ACTN|nr:VTT domain-containing protein [Streptomyces fuscus]MDL2079396.1 VTT domain-containing protein [Streptomyces fuscus]
MLESFESVGSLAASPWIYGLVALSVLLDVFLPVLPSGVLVIMASTAAALPATAAAAGRATQVPDILALTLCAATASVLGDLVAYRLAWHGGLDRALARSRRLTLAQERLGTALSRGGGALVVLARFAPAGRSVVSFCAGAAQRPARDFLPWSALAGLSWASFSVALGYFGAQWMGAGWVATGVSLAALVAVGAVATYLVRREPA